MAHYLIEVAYTAQSWSTQIDHPGNAVDRITPAVEACGGTLHGLYYAFGDVDVVGIIEFPTPEEAAAFALAVGASGALKLFRTTPLLTIEQGMASMRRAAEVRTTYSPPITVSLVDQATAR